MKPLSIIVAIADNYGIGKDNKLLAHIPGDLPRFRKITTGHTVIMGKNTFLSLPGGALKDRKNIVISDDPADRFKDCMMVSSIEDAIVHCDPDEENFIIGGASIYRQFLPMASRLYLTLIHKHLEADTFFPEINYSEWKEISREKPATANGDFEFEYLILERKN